MKKSNKHDFDRLRVTTPVGVAQFPHLNTPDTTWNKDGEYRVDLVFDPDDSAWVEFTQKIEAFGREQHAKAGLGKDIPVLLPMRAHQDKDKVPTGQQVFRAKAKALYRTDSNAAPVMRKLVFVDRFAKEITDPPSVGFGSHLRLAGDMAITLMASTPEVIALGGPPKKLYVSFYPKWVQIVELVAGAASFEDYGMGAMGGEGGEEGAPF